MPSTQTLKIDDIRTDGDIQPREAINEDVVAEYAARMEEGDTFPAVVVYADGSDNWLADGYHRVMAATRNGWIAIDAEVRKGTKTDAMWFASSANRANGLRMTNADKKRAVMHAVKARPSESDNAIAKHVGVSQPTVTKYRTALEATSKVLKSNTRTTSDGRTINTANIGRKPKPANDDYEFVEGQDESTSEIIDTTTGEVLENAAVVTT
ncbi:MAG: ParB N-terminal domain-containing protein, partial [Phycisphaerales bacterium JB063]